MATTTHERTEPAVDQRASSAARVPELDGIRGVAILLVSLHHFVGLPDSALVRETWFHVFEPLLSLTWVGVDLFFALSGFLIAGILIDHKGREGYYRVFYSRRFRRVLPLYCLVLVAYLIGAALGGAGRLPWLFGDPGPFWVYPAFVQNFWMADANRFGPQWLGPTWSLAVEEQFYLLLPMAVAASSRRGLAGVGCAGVALAPVARKAFAAFYPGATGAIGNYVLFPSRMDALCVGVLIALLVRSAFWPRVAALRRAFPPLFLALVAAVFYLNSSERFNPMNSAIAAACGSLLLAALTNPDGPIAAVLRLVWLRRCGVLCYGLYLLQHPIQGLCYGLIRGKAPRVDTPGDVLVSALALALTFTLAHLSWEWFERPILRRAPKWPR